MEQKPINKYAIASAVLFVVEIFAYIFWLTRGEGSTSASFILSLFFEPLILFAFFINVLRLKISALLVLIFFLASTLSSIVALKQVKVTRERGKILALTTLIFNILILLFGVYLLIFDFYASA